MLNSLSYLSERGEGLLKKTETLRTIPYEAMEIGNRKSV